MPEMHILIADDDPNILVALKLLLEDSAYQVSTAASPKEVLEIAQAKDIDLAIMDLNYSLDTTSGVEGIELLQELRKLDDTLPLVVMTGWGSIDLAVEAMQSGAADFIQKPWDNQRLVATVANLLRLRSSERKGLKLSAENDLLRSKLVAQDGRLIAESVQMRRLLELIDQVANSGVSILLTGENGTGKSLLARYIHQQSDRRDEAFISVNMGSLSEGLFESEMFGHIKGSFTDAKENRIGRVELADGGTLFLDEIGNTPMSQQAKLLRVLEEQQFEKVGSSQTQSVDIRLITATNMNLDLAIEAGHFRSDLLYRINTLEIDIPPLRERVEDIVPLAEYFFAQSVAKYRSTSPGLSNEAIRSLTAYVWPGNVRELQHVIERAVLLCGDGHAEVGNLVMGSDRLTQTFAAKDGAKPESLEDIEKAAIQQSLTRFGGNAREAAQSLGLSRSAFYRRLEKYGL